MDQLRVLSIDGFEEVMGGVVAPLLRVDLFVRGSENLVQLVYGNASLGGGG